MSEDLLLKLKNFLEYLLTYTPYISNIFHNPLFYYFIIFLLLVVFVILLMISFNEEYSEKLLTTSNIIKTPIKNTETIQENEVIQQLNTNINFSDPLLINYTNKTQYITPTQLFLPIPLPQKSLKAECIDITQLVNTFNLNSNKNVLALFNISSPVKSTEIG
jgi:hypothetical protein